MQGWLRYNTRDPLPTDHEPLGTFFLLHFAVAAHDVPVSASVGLVRSGAGGARAGNWSRVRCGDGASVKTCASRHLARIRPALVAKAESAAPILRADDVLRRCSDAALCRPVLFLRRRHPGFASFEEQGLAGSRAC